MGRFILVSECTASVLLNPHPACGVNGFCSRTCFNVTAMHYIAISFLFSFFFCLFFFFFEPVAVLLNSSFLPQRNMSLGAGEIPI